MDTTDLSRLERWEVAGGTWRLAGRHRGPHGESIVTIALCRCDGGEEVDRFVSADPDLVRYVEDADRDGSRFEA